MFERNFFVVAPSFHGSTLLTKLLNDHPEVVSLGDTYPSNRMDQLCGCGKRVSVCPFWQEIAAAVHVDRYKDYPHWLPDYPAITGSRADQLMYNTLPPSALARLIPDERRSAFATDFANFTHGVQVNCGSENPRIFVDGVKSVARVAALAASGIRVDGVIHLQRDPGDYVQSAMKQHGYRRASFVRRLLKYRLFHNRARRIGDTVPYFSVTYEGLSEWPEETLNGIFRFLGVEPRPLMELVNEGKHRPWHFMGNASLFGFDGRIRASRHQQTSGQSMLTRLLAGRYHFKELHPVGGRG